MRIIDASYNKLHVECSPQSQSTSDISKLSINRYIGKNYAGFSHPWGTHDDDVFWSIALAVYATADMGPEPFLVVVPRE